MTDLQFFNDVIDALRKDINHLKQCEDTCTPNVLSIFTKQRLEKENELKTKEYFVANYTALVSEQAKKREDAIKFANENISTALLTATKYLSLEKVYISNPVRKQAVIMTFPAIKKLVSGYATQKALETNIEEFNFVYYNELTYFLTEFENLIKKTK